MRFQIIVGLLFLLFIQVSAASRAQNVSINVNNAPLEKVFRMIEQQSGYVFLYDDVRIKRQKVSLSLQNAPIEKVLKTCLENLPVAYKIVDRNILLKKRMEPQVQQVQYQQRQVTGVVRDSTGSTLQGVSVTVKGTSRVTVSDASGQYQIAASPGDVLIFSSVGYKKQEIVVADDTRLDVVMKVEVSSLEEAVVVGYGTQKKINLTGAVSQIGGERLANRAVTNIGQALQGAVSNLNISSTNGGAPGANSSFNVRGYTGFSASGGAVSQSPLFVVDGIPGVDINTININDVESISVLKDAASAAIYGSSAPYGVVIVTTKQGKTGTKPTITYNNNLLLSQPINLPKYMRSIDFANLYNEAADNAGTSRPFSDDALKRIQDYLDGKIKTETIANPATGTDAWFEWGNANANNDWFDILFRRSQFSQQHNIGVSGGTNSTRYYVGLGYNKQNGMYNYTDDSYNRYNVRANLSTVITPWMNFNFRTALSRGISNTPTAEGNWMQTLAARNWPTEPLYTPNGSFASENRMAGLARGGHTFTTTDKAVVTGELVLNPLQGWNITGNYTIDASYFDLERDIKTVYVQRPSGAEQSIITPNGIQRQNQKNQHYTANLYSSYEKEWNGHSFRGLVGFTQELYDNKGMNGSNNYLYSNDKPALSLTYGASPALSDNASQLAIRGGFGRLNYNYRGKYLLEFNGRYDGTSRFLSARRFKFYPGISGAWVVSNERLWKPLAQVLNVFKLRASYGQLGDQGFTNNYYPFYPSLVTVSPTSSNFLFSGGREAYIGQPPLIDPSLTWVTVKTLDLGIDLSALDNRLNVTFGWYRRTADDFVGPAQAFPAFLGTAAPQVNNTGMVTHGFDLTLGWKDRINDFKYGVEIVLGDYQSKVLRYPNPTGLNTTWYVGENFGDIWGYQTVGFFKTNEEIAQAPKQNALFSRWSPGDIRYADLNGDGVINWGDNTLANPGDRKVIANTTPRYSFGVNLTAQYKNADLVVFLQGVAKRDAVFYNADVWDGAYFWGITGDMYTGMLTTAQYDRWTPETPNGYYPKFYMSGETRKNSQPQTRYVQNAAYLRIKNIQLGYALQPHFLKRIDCDRLRFFANVENLATFTRLIKTMDPEFSATDGRVYPFQRVWSCGVNITF
ncbi:TonB-dependent receptor [Niabella sp. CC-SYL272]|uniref:TonB-dependent receptor n=1 Tax=Niabella agricola TaxID=2891571 RepID=UPI001F16780A|nr:TonB-dependent receptor [Niabella agricola]MCF3110641.1 TonB-dependent receptor [Niabella agricola]